MLTVNANRHIEGIVLAYGVTSPKDFWRVSAAGGMSRYGATRETRASGVGNERSVEILGWSAALA